MFEISKDLNEVGLSWPHFPVSEVFSESESIHFSSVFYINKRISQKTSVLIKAGKWNASLEKNKAISFFSFLVCRYFPEFKIRNVSAVIAIHWKISPAL